MNQPTEALIEEVKNVNNQITFQNHADRHKNKQ